MADKIELGKDALYVDQYSPELLAPIPRSFARAELPFGGPLGDQPLPFTGSDIWTAYELSWLDMRGKPVVAMAEFIFPCDSSSIVESKSFKYYLNSFNQTQFSGARSVAQVLHDDLTQSSGGQVEVVIRSASDMPVDELPGECVDDIEVDIQTYEPDPSLLEMTDQRAEKRQLFSHLLKSNCPVTGQPDWATVWVEYSGNEILPESFLKYVISYRKHQGFHENCVERMFSEIMTHCEPEALSVYARYTRRGGLDINPYRTNCGGTPPEVRLARQ